MMQIVYASKDDGGYDRLYYSGILMDKKEHEPARIRWMQVILRGSNWREDCFCIRVIVT